MAQARDAWFVAIALLAPHAGNAFPDRPVRIVALNPPGGVSDIVARTLGEKLTERWGIGVVVDNRVGASGIVGSEIVARSQPDGHTLLLGFVGNLAIIPSLVPKIPYDPVRDFAPVSLAARSPIVIVVHPPLPARNVKDLIALARAQPGKLAYGSSGSGNGNHLATELLATMAQVKLLHVPYKGGPPALTSVIQGETSFMLGNSAFVVPQVKAGRVRAIAVSTEQRLALLPEVPTVAESGVPDFVVTTWFAVLAPAATPGPIVTRLNAEIGAILGDASVREKLDRAGLIPSPSTPAQLADLIRTESARWGKVIRDTGARPD